MTFGLDSFIDDLTTLVGFRTEVCRNRSEFERANQWIKDFLHGLPLEFVEFDCNGLTSMIIKPVGSERPRMIGDGHIEVVPGPDRLFDLRQASDYLHGRGVADMKTQVLAMLYAVRDLALSGDHRDFWVVLGEDEEVGSAAGAAVVVDYLVAEGLLPSVVFAPDGGPNFGYVEKEKGIATFTVTARGVAAHASRPYLADNAIDNLYAVATALRDRFPDPADEQDWRPSVAITQVTAGDAANRIPDSAEGIFDLRFTEASTPDEIRTEVARIATDMDAEVSFEKVDAAAYYPKEAPVAQRFIELLTAAGGGPPDIIHSAGASNGRIYAGAGEVHVLMSNPAACGAHGEDEWVAVDSLEPYYRLVLATASMEL
jgi:succinyl-diaminopimelate desuccinylase